MASATGANDRLRNDDIGLERRLELFRLQVEIRDCEKRAHDLFLQNMIKGTSHLSLGQEAVAAGFGVAMRKGDNRSAPIGGTRIRSPEAPRWKACSES
jgi:acetoin:2,6-dichlorophenolindophenol oxidoreductase subunit alpha